MPHTEARFGALGLREEGRNGQTAEVQMHRPDSAVGERSHSNSGKLGSRDAGQKPIFCPIYWFVQQKLSVWLFIESD